MTEERESRKTLWVAIGAIIGAVGVYLLSFLFFSMLGWVKSSGRDLHSLDPTPVRLVYRPARALFRSIDLNSSRPRYEGEWASTDPSFPYVLRIESFQFHEILAQERIGEGDWDPVTFQDNRHHEHRTRSHLVMGDGTRYLYFEPGILQLNVPDGPQVGDTQPMKTYTLTRVE